jgi:hypothetical protein
MTFQGLAWQILVPSTSCSSTTYQEVLHQQNKTYLIPLITSYSLLKPLILGVRMACAVGLEMALTTNSMHCKDGLCCGLEMGLTTVRGAYAAASEMAAAVS